MNDWGLLNRLSTLAFLLFLILFLVPRAYALGLPFVMVSAVSPSPLEVYDVAAFTVHVESGGAVPVKLLSWAVLRTADMVVEWNASAPLNQTGSLDYVVYHPFKQPGDYFMQAKILDIANRTAEDIYQFKVERQTTVLTLQVSARSESFTVKGGLADKYGSPIADGDISFWYGSDGVNWLQITTAKTDTNGTAQAVFTPTPEEGGYQFQAKYLGDSLRQPSQSVYLIERNQTALTFTVTPSNVNQTASETFLLQACLTTTKDDKPLPDMRVTFYYYYTNQTQEWTPITDARTSSDGCTIALFKPPYEGTYEFKVTYAGGLMFASNESYFMNATAMPEFNSIPIAICVCLAILLVVRRAEFFE